MTVAPATDKPITPPPVEESDGPASPSDDPEYVGCFADTAKDRVMIGKLVRDNVTAALCRAYCTGFMYYGTQVF